MSVQIPAIGVDSDLLHLGVTASGVMRVPSLSTAPGRAAWYKYSPTPGQIGVSVIEGHVDSYQGPAVFFRLGALRPGDRVDVKLATGSPLFSGLPAYGSTSNRITRRGLFTARRTGPRCA